MRLLQRRMDALHVRYQGRVSPDVRSRLSAALIEAKELDLASIAIEIGGTTLALSARSREGWWHLQNGLLELKIDEGGHLDGWGLTVKLRALALADLGPAACVALAGELATATLHLVTGERVAWIDLCADFEGFDVDSIAAPQWVTSGRARASRRAPTPDQSTTEYFRAAERVAFYVGRNDIVMRLYDKTVELQNDVTGEKRDAEHTSWRAAGWNGDARVARVEFQVRGDALDEIDAGALRDPTRMLDRLDALWAYLTRKWLRLGVIGSATRRGRWTNDCRWDAVQAVRFERQGEVPRRVRERGAPRIKYVTAINLTYAAKTGLLDAIEIPRAREIAKWNPISCREFVRGTLGTMLGIVGDRVAYDLLRVHGAGRAAMVLAEQLHARRAAVWVDDKRQAA